ncbi:peptidase S8/S53 domain-containing protein [Xylogone sp. PMI_703]|nr:peptidase S8/S53 domain-containing protein [Xylogone sp. PMI_703]
MLAAFDAGYCKTGSDANYDSVYPDPLPDGYNSSDCGTVKPPRTPAITYAFDEASYSDAYIERQCLEFLKLGLQGTTVLTGSGDRGSEDQLGECIDLDTGTPNATSSRFASVFPASCPWLTVVGGTQLQLANRKRSDGAIPPDEASLQDNVTISGRAFSHHFSVPRHQAELETHFAHLSRQGYFNPQGRSYPDVSALALGYLIIMYGEYYSVKGTSASTPVIASMIARVNDARLHVGKGTIGFINPVLYGFKDDITRDVRNGFNSGCGVSAFLAIKGWDAVTGLGSVDFEKLLEVYARLPCGKSSRYIIEDFNLIFSLGKLSGLGSTYEVQAKDLWIFRCQDKPVTSNPITF